MKEFIIGLMFGSVAAFAFSMTDAGCRFACKAKNKIAKVCKCAEKEFGKMQEDAKKTVEELRDALTTE